MKKSLILSLLGISLLGSLVACKRTLPYQDPSLSAEQRADDLLPRLTLEEKASLMQNNSPAIPRLGIKAYNWWNEALHGVARSGLATVFPQAIGMGASFDDALLYDVFTAVSDEARVKSRVYGESGELKQYQGLTFWTPNINIFRDPRWGRGQETYGEDPYLTGQMGMAVIHGLQGPDTAKYDKLHACAKHFAVHSGPEWNRHKFDVESLAPRDLWETYLPAFKDAVQKANVREVMCAYQRFEGEPCCDSEKLLTQILRQEWGYQGIVVSDCGAISDFYQSHGHLTSPDQAHAASSGVLSGTDLECGSEYSSLADAVKQGLIEEKQIDVSLRRLLIDRFRLGEMDAKPAWEEIPESVLNSAEHQALALRMARESIVLLQNKGGLLPLDKATLKKVAVVGPNANDSVMQWANYNGFPSHTVTLLEGIQAALPQCEVIYERGCDLTADTLDTAAAIARVKDADIVIFAGGISPKLEGEEMPVSIPGFKGGDRTDIELPSVQRTFLQQLRTAGKKVVYVNFSGSAIGLVPETGSCDAILQAWYPGQAGGTAIADVLLGEYNPAGRLPVTFYQSVAQLPDYEDYAMKGRTYRYLTQKPLFPFGHGLSYTTFGYGDARLSKASIAKNETLTLTIPVTNTGSRDGDEVVQVYLKRTGDGEGPQRTLRAFKRVSIPAGQTVEVALSLNTENFEWFDTASNTMRPIPGGYELLYGGSSDAGQLKTVEVSVL
ncbi:MAG: glycoside hydrolase family 3 C-terminal domain-containing protein [Mediterranea sp.]|nr:glycoside hydrolase family 3 C-terminal domain-containing protein [Mediterranea sp.]